MKKIAVIAVSLGLSQVAFAEGERYLPVLANYLILPSDRHVPELKDGYGVDARYGVVVDERWNYEIGAFYDPWNAEAGDSGYHSGVGADVLMKFGQIWSVTPFLIGGGGLAYSDLFSGTVKDPRAGLMLDLGAGVMTRPFAQVWDRPLSARIQAKANYEIYDRGYIDVRVYAGLQLALTAPPAPAAAEPVAVVPPAELPPEPVAEAPPPAPVTLAEAPAPEPATPTIETAQEGDTIVLRGVNFETGKATLTANARTLLDDVADQLAKRPELSIEIGGHTDSVGRDAYNQDLSERRAQAVLDYLVAKGIDAAHLGSVGYGETQPIDTNDTAEGRERNRRVEMKVIAGAAR